MAHVAKYTQVQTGHLFNHYNREKERECNRSNSDIDKTRTKENYNLMEREETPQQYFENRLNELYHMDRKDVKVMCDWVVTLPQDYKDSERAFFAYTVEFLNHRYGTENCVGAFIHMDEKQPHLHYSFIPVAEDTNPDHEQHEKVCAKDVLTRKDLQGFHDDLQRHLRDKMPDREINIITGITKEQGRNLEVRELKLNTLSESVKEKEKELADREERLSQKADRQKEQKQKNLERQKELDKQKKDLEKREVVVNSKRKDIENSEQAMEKEQKRHKDFERYMAVRDDYLNRTGTSPDMYEKQCLMSKYTGQEKPYPEMINPTLDKEERDSIVRYYREQQNEKEPEPQRDHDREQEPER